ncbi:hypothetical protein [Bowmanella dokdonensis]|uniref:Cache domain-containing protein n=1 Tax=Bowmanella dokdonensis TaxID=751969 RepID=A0A939DQT9_9ALTE|nr:hypothetical protein [Bowmanella dokdonensis]MBN7826196.1 hypothetical protein [Bowmanella dokdonensis]
MATDESSGSHAVPVKWKKWLYSTIFILIAAGYFYYQYAESQDRLLNRNYYRILSEAANKFNENLFKLDSLFAYDASIPSITSQFPSYSKDWNNSGGEHIPLSYSLDWHELTIHQDGRNDSIEVRDILPLPQYGFSQYLFANQDGIVLASSGVESTISVVDLTSIAKAMQTQTQGWQFFRQQQTDKETKVQLPSLSRHLDMPLSYGEYRIFIYPFRAELQIKPGEKMQTAKNIEDDTALDQLYLVGLLPMHELDKLEGGLWTPSWLIILFSVLFFSLTLLWLFLLPDNRAISRGKRVGCQLIAYVFYLVTMSYLIAAMQDSLLGSLKKADARLTARELVRDIERDLYEAFTALASHRPFFRHLVSDYGPQEKRIREAMKTPLGENTGQGHRRGWNECRVNLHQADIEKQVRPWLANYYPQATLPAGAGAMLSAYQQWMAPQSPPLSPLGTVSPDHQANLLHNESRFYLHVYPYTARSTKLADIYANSIQVVDAPGGRICVTDSYVTAPHHLEYLKNVFVIDNSGRMELPSLYFIEDNGQPNNFNLSHREYFKQVRDFKGLTLSLARTAEDGSRYAERRFDNVFIQRLLNIGVGTRGTTLSMPLEETPRLLQFNPVDGDPAPRSVRDSYVLAADVLLPRISLRRPGLQDFVTMVVDRNDGGVLFHTDTARAMVENLFQAGDGTTDITTWLRAGLDKSMPRLEASFDGTYHGQEGRFLGLSTPVPDWAVVVFYPYESLQALKFTHFLLLLGLLLMAHLLLALLRWLYAGKPQGLWGSPLADKDHHQFRADLLLGSMLLVAVTWIWSWLRLYQSFLHPDYLLIMLLILLIPLIGVGLALWHRRSSISLPLVTPRTGSVFWPAAISVLLLSLALWWLESRPLGVLLEHYRNTYCNSVNQERAEMQSVALNNFPNSITGLRRDPFSLLPDQTHWISQPAAINAYSCEQYPTEVDSADYPRLNSLLGLDFLWKWIQQPPGEALQQPLQKLQQAQRQPYWQHWGYFWLLPALLLIWYLFYHKILLLRLYYHPSTIRLLKALQGVVRDTGSTPPQKNAKIAPSGPAPQAPQHKLLLKLAPHQTGGTDLTVLNALSQQTQEDATDGLQALFNNLRNKLPSLHRADPGQVTLPNVKINISESAEVALWDIETSLCHETHRHQLLSLIIELKALVQLQTVARLTLFMEANSLHMIRTKARLSSQPGKGECAPDAFLSWSECLIDFHLVTSGDFSAGLDRRLIESECRDLPQLAQLLPPLTEAQPQTEAIWLRDDERTNLTLTWILLHADALYRFKWETCSNREKLALYHLAMDQNLNPLNQELMEKLVFSGMAMPDQQRLRITNQSLVRFILTAETEETLALLESQGAAGIWQDYKLPIGAIVLLLVVGLAATSGQSLLMIAGAVTGLLTTLGNLFGSASTFKNHLK